MTDSNVSSKYTNGLLVIKLTVVVSVSFCVWDVKLFGIPLRLVLSSLLRYWYYCELDVHIVLPSLLRYWYYCELDVHVMFVILTCRHACWCVLSVLLLEELMVFMLSSYSGRSSSIFEIVLRNVFHKCVWYTNVQETVTPNAAVVCELFMLPPV